MSENYDVSNWLESLGLGQYAATFSENELTRETLLTLTDEDLQELGVEDFDHRQLLLSAIVDATGGGSTAFEQPQPDEEPAAPAAPLPVTRGFAIPPLPPVTAGGKSRLKGRLATLLATVFASKILLMSVGVHLFLGVGATFLIVQSINAKRKVTFQGGPPAVDPSARALEHKVSVSKKQKSGGAPAQAKRIVTSGMSKLALPEMPSMPTATTIVPGMAAGMGGAGFGTGTGIGNGNGAGMGGGFGGGGGLGLRMLPPALACRCSTHERLLKLSQNGGKPEVEAAVTRSLDWLKAHQNADGTWGSNYKVGMTGFALLCYFGRCVTPEDPQYGETVKKGLTALIAGANKNDRGLLSSHGPDQNALYEHGIATYALGEMLALKSMSKTQIPNLKETFEAAVKFVIGHQLPCGGWCYLTRMEGNNKGDLSVTGWEFQTLKAAKLNNLQVEGLHKSISSLTDYIKSTQTLQRGHATATAGGFGSPNTTGAYNQYSLTGVGVLALQTLAKGGNGSDIQRALKFANLQFREDPPNWDSNCNLYAWYYYSQAYFQEGGKDWEDWNSTAMQMVLNNQNPDGTWKAPGPSKHGGAHEPAGADGAVYRTALCTLILEVYYRYLKVGS